MWESAFFVLCLLTGSAVAQGEGSAANCYEVTAPTMVGIVAGDIFITLLLLIPVYYCTRQKGKKPVSRKDEARNYVNMVGY